MSQFQLSWSVTLWKGQRRKHVQHSKTSSRLFKCTQRHGYTLLRLYRTGRNLVPPTPRGEKTVPRSLLTLYYVKVPPSASKQQKMPKSCRVVGCTINCLMNPELSFYKLPNRKTEPWKGQRWMQVARCEASAGRIRKLLDPDTQCAFCRLTK